MSYQNLEDMTGVGKFITIRNKQTGVPFKVGMIEDEISISDGEQKYFIQWVRLQPPQADEGHAQCSEFCQRIDQVLQGAPEAVDLPDQDCVKPSAASI